MMMVIMIMTMIFQAATTIMLQFLEQVPQVNNGSRFYLPGLLEMNTHLKNAHFKTGRIAQEQESIDETVLFLRKWRRLSGQVSQKKHTQTKQKLDQRTTMLISG